MGRSLSGGKREESETQNQTQTQTQAETETETRTEAEAEAETWARQPLRNGSRSDERRAGKAKAGC
jgi:hypothetical protein